MQIALVTPQDCESQQKNAIFKKENWIEIKSQFETNGMMLNTIDMYDDISECDYIIFRGLYESYDYLHKCLKLKLENKLIYMNAEPPIHDKNNSIRGCVNLKKYFKYIFTFFDELVDNQTYFKRSAGLYLYGDYKKSQYTIQRQRLLTSISSNLFSKKKEELYSERRKVINYFESNNLYKEFDFYGYLWPENKYKTYKGVVKDKIETYQKYKYAICFENSICESYISEKIFDCMKARVIPIYYGAPDIEKIIPKGCYIDYRQFKSVDDMYNHLKDLDDSLYNEYINNINKFLGSECTYEFTTESFYNNVMKVINLDNKKNEIRRFGICRRSILIAANYKNVFKRKINLQLKVIIKGYKPLYILLKRTLKQDNY